MRVYLFIGGDDRARILGTFSICCDKTMIGNLEWFGTRK